MAFGLGGMEGLMTQGAPVIRIFIGADVERGLRRVQETITKVLLGTQALNPGFQSLHGNMALQPGNLNLFI